MIKKWFSNAVNKRETKGKSIEKEMNIRKLLINWFENFDRYFRIYGHGKMMTRKIHESMDFQWGIHLFEEGASYHSDKISIFCSKQRRTPVAYEVKIEVNVGGSTICIWKNGAWRHETPSLLKDKVNKHLLIIQQFNEDCKYVDFEKLMAEASAENDRKKREQEADKYKEERELLLRDFENI